MIVIPVQSAAELLPPEHASAGSTQDSPSSRSSGASSRQKSAYPARSLSPASSRSARLTPDEDAIVSAPSFAKLSKDIARDFGRLYEAVAGARRIVVVCGAGISVSAPANIPDFRSSSGLFQKLKDQHPNAGLTSGKDLFDARLFNSEKTSDLFYTMIAELKEMADRARPTAFHHLLKKLDTEGRLLRVYTQNIDGLEERAGLTFGLAAGPTTSSSVALGKRKRGELNPTSRLPEQGLSAARRAVWSRTQSDSALLWADQASGNLANGKTAAPMFPRTIPLHGSLNSMTCGRCGHQEILENAFKTISERLAEYEEYRLKMSDEPQPEEAATIDNLSADSKIEGPKVVPELKHLDVKEVLRSLRAGEHIPCPRCETADEVRLAAGLRSRGVGRMKPDVVLYGGQNDGAERVGECLSRDILGLRDPNETQVPETIAEIRAKERRALKETERAMTASRQAKVGAHARPEDADLSVGAGQNSQDDTLAAMFLAEEDQANEDADQLAPLITDLAPAPRLPRGNAGAGNRLNKIASKSKSKKQLKPLPPDLLIVAGTSLKVSGTKRIIREFAKACHARDYRYYPGDESSDEGDSTAGSRPSTPRRRLRKRSTSVDEEDEDEVEEEEDPKAPIRTILLNYEFPSPSGQWEDVFDMWIQGDVQKAARGLWPMPNTNSAFSTLPLTDEEEEMINVAARLAGVNAAESWAHLKDHLDEQRVLEKKYKGKSAATSKRKVKEEECMPPKLVALSLNTLGALTTGSAKPVPLPQLGRKRSFVKSKTLSSIQFGGNGRSVSLSASLSTCTSREGSLLRSRSPDSDGSSLTSLTESPRSSPAVDWTGEAQLGKLASRATDGSPVDELEIVIPATKPKKGSVTKTGKKGEGVVEVPGTPKGSRTGTAANTPKKTTPKSPSKRANAAPTQDVTTPTKAATPSKKTTSPKKTKSASPSKVTAASKKATSLKVEPATKASSSASPQKKAKATVKTAAASKVRKAATTVVKTAKGVKKTKAAASGAKATAKSAPKKGLKKPAAVPSQQTALNFVATAAPNKTQTKAAGVKKGSKGKSNPQQVQPAA